MSRMTVFIPIGLFLLLVALAGCAVTRPAPASIILFDGRRELQLKPADASYAAVTAQLANLIAGLDTPLYAHYPPDRVAAEILTRPHLVAAYTPAVTLQGKGYAAQASRLIVVVTGEGPLVLTQAREGADWTACEASEAGRFTSLFRVIREQTGVELQAVGR